MAIEIQFQHSQQVALAELLWNADTQEEVDAILAEHGRMAYVVRDMLIAAQLDEVQDTDIAEAVIKRIKQLG